ncbi:MAG: hypothetical protein EOQ53_29745 [Mesorhizobium sp.]|nr:MAG: hypothetical protein EOQ53_29745 [Mesorhizobium sp.]
MKKLLVAALTALAAGTGLAYALTSSGPSHAQIEDAVSGSWNVQQLVGSSWMDDKVMVLVAWKDPSRAQDASRQICQFFPKVSKIHWDDSAGDPHRYECQ